MLRFKVRNSALARRKFAGYRLWFALSLGLFLAALAAEMILVGPSRRAVPDSAAFRQAFAALVTGEGVLYLAVLLCGVTVYAPVCQLFTALCRGFSSGFVLSSLLPLHTARSFFALAAAALYLLLSALWFLAYASFCTCVSLKIFATHTEKGARGEERLFGGTLFYSELFCGTVNLRFLFSYTLFFFASLAGQCALSALFALARTRLT